MLLIRKYLYEDIGTLLSFMFLEFRMTVAQAYLTKRDTDVEHVQEENAHLSQ